MALPIDQTITLLVTEALQISGIQNPTAADITRAGDNWLRPAIEMIAKRIDLPLFEETQISLLKPYEVRYALPDSFDRMSEVTVYTGKQFNTIQTSTVSTITLSATETITESSAKGKLLFITSGIAINTMVRIIGYNETTKIVNISPSIVTLPVAGDGYLLPDTETFLELQPESEIGSIISIGFPRAYHIYGKTPQKELYFDRSIPDTEKGMIKIRYSQYPHQVDLTDPKMTWIYNELMSELTQGVLIYSLTNIDDTRKNAEFQIFEKMIFDYNKKINREKILGVQMFRPN